LNEAARRPTPDRLTIPALKGPVAELFQLNQVAHSQDAIDQLPLLALAVGCLAALHIGDFYLGLAHSP
jgi:hypothetical protein